jgi:hypothetical protein
MDPNKTTLERAFELARSGDIVDLYGLRERLRREAMTEGNWKAIPSASNSPA